MNHDDLCKLAVDWLRRPASRMGPGCLMALSETSSAINGEIPDAIGWRPYAHNGSGSTLIEVKVNRADFLADAKKKHRQQMQNGMGVYRYFMVPAGLISISDLPPKWGLIEVTDRGHIKPRAGHVFLPNIRPKNEDDPWRFDFNQAAELSLLVLALNRVGDPQKVQDMIRDANNKFAHASKTIESLRARNNKLSSELFRLRREND